MLNLNMGGIISDGAVLDIRESNVNEEKLTAKHAKNAKFLKVFLSDLSGLCGSRRFCEQTFEIRPFFETDGMIERVTCAFDFGQLAPRFLRGLVDGCEKRFGVHAAGAGGLHQSAASPQDAQAEARQLAVSG
jgi:hypothetical protein